MFNKEEIKKWEQEVEGKQMQKFYSHERKQRNPQKEKLKEKEKKQWIKTKWHTHEYPEVRYSLNRKYRRKYNSEKLIDNEAYYNLRPRDYKTYGWESH